MRETDEKRAGQEGGRVFLTVEQAMAALVEGEYVHAFRQGGFALIGADWEREKVREHMEEHRPELMGPTAAALKHGIGCIDAHGPVAFETDPDRLAELEATARTPHESAVANDDSASPSP